MYEKLRFFSNREQISSLVQLFYQSTQTGPWPMWPSNYADLFGPWATGPFLPLHGRIGNPTRVRIQNVFEFTQLKVTTVQGSPLTVPKPWTGDSETKYTR